MKALKNERGYTLVETVIAVSLACVVLTALYNTCLAGAAFYKKNDHRLEVQDNLTISMDRITRELRQARELYFTSTDRRLCFKDTSGNIISYYLEGTTLKRHLSIGEPIANHLTEVNFAYLPWGTGDAGQMARNSMVRITLTGEKGKSGPVTLSSTVRIRAAR